MMLQDKCWEYVYKWKMEHELFLNDALSMEDGLQFKFWLGILTVPSTLEKQLAFLQEVVQADAAHMFFGKNILFLAYANTANRNMSTLGFAILFGNKEKENWSHFRRFIRKTHPIINQPKKTILTDQDKGSLSVIKEIIPSAGMFYCSFHCRHNIIRQCGGSNGHTPLTAIWLYNMLCGCKSLALFRATRLMYKDQMHPTDHHYLFLFLRRCESQLPGVLRENSFTCKANCPHLGLNP
jgi:hypothetical protein